MSDRIILTGIVLRSSPVGEYNKRLVILTKERGRVTAFARGARRPKSSLQAATELFCCSGFEAYEGKDAVTIVKAQIKEPFREISQDLDKTYYGSYFLELAEYFSAENQSAVELLNLLYLTLKRLIKAEDGFDRIRRIYELRLLVINGTYPNVFSCARCGTKEGLTRFDPTVQGVICVNCRPATRPYGLNAASLYTLQYIISSPLNRLYAFRMSDEVFEKIRRIIREFFSYYIDRPLQTAKFLPEE